MNELSGQLYLPMDEAVKCIKANAKGRIVRLMVCQHAALVDQTLALRPDLPATREIVGTIVSTKKDVLEFLASVYSRAGSEVLVSVYLTCGLMIVG